MNTKWQEIYTNNKQIDNIFIERYGKEKDYFKKNAIEFLVELGEFTNETKCFKYWTIKKPDKDKVLDEFADCMTMILLFFNLSNLELDAIPMHTPLTNKLDVINLLYEEGSKLITAYDDVLVKEIFSNLLYLISLFDYQEDDIINAISKKQTVVLERLNSDY